MQKISLFILFCCLSIASYGTNKYCVATGAAPVGTASYCYGAASASSYTDAWTGCSGSALGSAGGISYQWLLNGTPVAAGTFTITAGTYSVGSTVSLAAGALSFPAAGTYTLSVLYSWGATVTGCTMYGASLTSSPLVITVHSQPTVAVTPGSATSCGSTSVTLTASGSSATYSWQPNDGTLSALSGASVTASPIFSEEYMVTATDANGCTNTATADISVVPLHINTVIATAAICSGGDITLTASVQNADYDFSAASPTSIAYAPASTSGATYVLNACAPFSVTGTDCDNQSSVTVPIPFTFYLYGLGYNTVNINSSGYINFGEPSTYSNSPVLPSPDPYYDGGGTGFSDAVAPGNLIALFMHNLDPDQGGTISYNTNGTAPNRQFVVTYSNVADYDAYVGSTTTCSGQIILHEGTNIVDLLIGSCLENDDPTYDYATTVGIQNADGTVASYPAAENGVNFDATSQAWRFAPAPVQVSSVTYTWAPGGASTYSLAVTPSVTTTYSLTVTDNASGCAITGTAAAVVTTNTNKWISGDATSPTDWNTADNWGCGSVPLITNDVLIEAPGMGGTSTFPVIAASAFGYANNLTLGSGAAITLGSGSVLSIGGNLSNNGVISGAGTASLTGTAITGTAITGNGMVSNMTLTNVYGTAIGSTSGDVLAITGALTLSAGTLTTNDKLVLVSTAAGTSTVTPTVNGYIAEIPTTNATPITGYVVVQQHFAGGDRAYRMVAHPFNASILLSQIEAYIDITGTGGSTNGFTTTVSNNPSCWWYHTLDGNSLLGTDPGITYFTSTNGMGVNAFNPDEGIMLYVRGAKGLGLDGAPYIPDSVSYQVIGAVNTGSLTVPMACGSMSVSGTPVQDYNLLGNPYPAATDIGTVLNNAYAAGRINGIYFYLWNPYLGTDGQFVSKTIGSPYYIGANESFEVRTAGVEKHLTFNESNKGTAPTEALMRHSAPEYLSLYLYNKDSHLMDMLDVKFTDDATDSEDSRYDAGKPPSPAKEQLYSWSGNHTPLAVDNRPYAEGKAIPLGLMTQSPQPFTIKVDQYNAPAGSSVYLHDKLLGQYTLLQQGASYTFVMDSSSAQRDSRFELRMGATAATAVQQPAGLEAVITPNPATSDITVTYSAAATGPTDIRITSITGQTAMTLDLGMQQSGSKAIAVSSLPAGVYMLTLTHGSDKVVRKLVKE